MDLTEFFTELESHHPTLTVDSLGRIRQFGPSPIEMSCPLQIVFGHHHYVYTAMNDGLTCTEVNAIISAADYFDSKNLFAQEIRKKLLELIERGKK